MHFPKYLETEEGELLVFAPSQTHAAMALRSSRRIVSAGLAGAARHPRGKFFGESSSLHLAADRQLDWSNRAWFEGTLDKQPIFATSQELLAHVGADDIAIAEMLEHDGLFFPSSGRRPAPQLLSFFLP